MCDGQRDGLYSNRTATVMIRFLTQNRCVHSVCPRKTTLVPEVEAECLRHLAQTPAGIVESVLSHYTALVSIGTGIAVPRHEVKDDVALLGLLDLW